MTYKYKRQISFCLHTQNIEILFRIWIICESGGFIKTVRIITNVDDYLNELSEYKNLSGILYRGQSDVNYSISSKISRSKIDQVNEYKIVRNELLKKGNELFRYKLPIEHLIKMNEYGVATRLIEFTFCPLTALFFAVKDTKNNADGEVIIFKSNEDEYNNNSFSINKHIKLISLLSRVESKNIEFIKASYKILYGGQITTKEVLEYADKNVFIYNIKEILNDNLDGDKSVDSVAICGNIIIDGKITDEIIDMDKNEADKIIKIPYKYKVGIKEELMRCFKINY